MKEHWADDDPNYQGFDLFEDATPRDLARRHIQTFKILLGNLIIILAIIVLAIFLGK